MVVCIVVFGAWWADSTYMRARFPQILAKRPHEQRGRGLMQNESDLLDTDLLPIRTAEGIPPAVCEAAPMGCPVVICFASCIGSSNVLELSTNRKSAPFPAR